MMRLNDGDEGKNENESESESEDQSASWLSRLGTITNCIRSRQDLFVFDEV